MLTAREAGGEAEAVARQTDRYIRFFNAPHKAPEAPKEVLNKVVEQGDDIRAWSYLTGDGRRFSTFRRQVEQQKDGKEAYKAIAASLWNTMGTARPGTAVEPGEFNFATFLTNFNKAEQNGLLRSAFRGTDYEKHLDDMRALAKLAGDVRVLQRLDNKSNSAGAFTTIAGVIAGVQAPMTTGAALLGGYAGAALMANPKFVRFLTSGLRSAARRPETFNLAAFTAELQRQARSALTPDEERR